MLRLLSRALAGLIVGAVLVALPVEAAPPRLQARKDVSAKVRLDARALRQRLDAALKASPLPKESREKLAAGYEKLPREVQEVATAVLDPGTAEILGRPELVLKRDWVKEHLVRIDPGRIGVLFRPWVDEVGPAGGGVAGEIGVAVGGNYTTDCEARLNGTAAPDSYYWSNNILLFRIPDAAAAGSSYNVSVHNSLKNQTSSSLPLRIVAPRGYRGVHGLSFANFGDPNIGWNVYSACLGQSNVELSDGSHRPSAQSWYDSTYKTVGAGGNCFGMSQLALRLREFTHLNNSHALDRVMHGSWVGSTVTWGAWTLPWNTQSQEAVESLQGTQLVEPMATHIGYQRANQDNKTAWTYADNMLDTQSRPVQNTLYGHAVVTFDTEIDGSSRKFCFYDNNHPYTETEVGGPDLDHGVTNWTTGSFSYGGYTRTRCYDPHELTGQPLLPAGVGPDSSAEGSAGERLVRFEVPRVQGLVITDEAGRGGPDGTGVPGLTELVPDMGLQPVPDTFPRIFLLQGAGGRTLKFSVPNDGRQTRQLACFSRGGVLQLEVNGASISAHFSQLDQPSAQVTLPDPAGSGLQRINITAPVGRDEERQLRGDSFQRLGATPLGVSLSADRGALELLNAQGAQPIEVRIELQRFRPGGNDARPAVQQTLTPGQLQRVGPQNWGALGGQLRLEQINLPANRLRVR